MEHLNYCRQMAKQFMALAQVPSASAQTKERLSHALDLAGLSQKFILPDGGYLFKDFEFRALDEDLPLRLPHALIAIEFPSGHAPTQQDAEKCSGCIVFARERDEEIAITYAVRYAADGAWGLLPEVSIKRTGYVVRDEAQGGCVPMNVRLSDMSVDSRNYQRPVGVLLGLMNALACSNVHIQRSEPKKMGKHIKAALPFDTYHVLTIDVPSKSGEGQSTGGHRSPREHLRRGHIRRLADGRRIWVNATVVASGRGAGVVTKDYAPRAAS